MSYLTVDEYKEFIEEYPELDTVCLDEVVIHTQQLYIEDCE